MSNAVITYLRTLSYKSLHDKKQTKAIVKAIGKFVGITHSTSYKNWFLDAQRQIIDQIDYEPFWEKVEIDWIFYFAKEGISGGDITNKMQAVEDVLVKCNLIDDDNYFCHQKGTYNSFYRKGNGGVELTIKCIK